MRPHLLFTSLLLVALALCVAGCTETPLEPVDQAQVDPNAQLPAAAAVDGNPDNFARAPAWLRPGAVLVYDGYSAFRNGDRYSDAAHTLWTFEITDIRDTTYAATVTVANAEYAGVQAQTYRWTYPNLQALDQAPLFAPPANPLVFFPSLYQLVGRSPYPGNQFYGNAYATDDAIMVAASIPDSGVIHTAVIDGQTGCLLSSSSKYPTQEVYLYLREMR